MYKLVEGEYENITRTNTSLGLTFMLAVQIKTYKLLHCIVTIYKYYAHAK